MKRNFQNLVHQGSGGSPVISRKNYPTSPAVPFIGVPMVRNYRESDDADPLTSPWSLPLPGYIPAHLQSQMTYQNDGVRGILRDRPTPTSTSSSLLTDNTSLNPFVPPVCIPADVEGFTADPFHDPFNIGDITTLSPFLPSGTAPLTYQWWVKDSAGTPTLRSTATDFVYTVLDSDIRSKDEFGLGLIDFILIIFNACNLGGHEEDGSFAAQGTPP